MDKEKLQQQAMHKDFFERCRFAIENGFYMEAILMEYAAMEARLEVMLGVLGLPCNKFLDAKQRKSIQISHRIACANYCRRNSAAFSKTKLPKNFFEEKKKIASWIEKRNRYVHGLYKNELEYDSRIKGAKELAERGLEYCRLLYNEVSRLRRLQKSHPEQFDGAIVCSSKKCQLAQIDTEEN